MRLALILTISAFASVPSSAQTRPSATLDVYVIDVEGGNSTLFVSPSRESLLIDTGNAGAAAARDAGRIVEAINDARRRRGQSLLRDIPSGTEQRRRPAIRRNLGGLRQVSHGAFRGSDEEQRIRADVSQQPTGRSGCALGLAPWAGELEFPGSGARSASS